MLWKSWSDNVLRRVCLFVWVFVFTSTVSPAPLSLIKTVPSIGVWSRVTNWSHADTDPAQWPAPVTHQASSGSARPGDRFMGLMCVLWSCKLPARQIAWHTLTYPAQEAHEQTVTQETRFDPRSGKYVPCLLVLVSLMENIDFWWPASVHYIQGMSHKMVRSHNCSLGPQTAPWGRADSRTETIMCADLSSLLSGAEWRQGATQVAARVWGVGSPLHLLCVRQMWHI